jgi:tetratricopeptide (TPR) repeat protein/tRNA A-37 threonylcarbamoyl transferase component Bud32
MLSVSTAASPEQLLDEVLADYLRAVHQGDKPSRQAYLDTFPMLADALRECFADEDHIERLAAPLRGLVNPSPALHPGLVLGDYELFEPIAEGGMGTVFRARQRSLDRLVAVKVLRTGRLATAAEWQRFRNEAEAVAQLDHPHIVPIYEVGEHAGLPFFSMKLLNGSLADHPGQYRDTPETAAELVASVAEAVHYAHERGLLHRDLKPANILLDASGRPHVSDFGLAKRFAGPGPTGVPELTHSGDVLGTPSYMSPEQALGGGHLVTILADVYGLGAILYELLTGQPPFRGPTALETLRQLRETEPPAVAGLNPRVDRNLETICLKCLAKEPERRYRSAADLAADLRRYLRGEPITARPATWFERGRAWCRRQPLIAALLTALVVVFIAGFTLVTWQWRRAELSNADREQQHLQAEAARADAQRMLDSFAKELSETPVTNQALQETRRRMLRSALTYYRNFLRERGDDPHLQEETARVQFHIGAITSVLGSAKDALASYQQALELTRKLWHERPDDRRVRANLARTLARIGVLQVETAQTEEGLHSYQEARGLLEESLREQAEDAVQADLAGLLTNLGNVCTALNRFDEAGDCFKREIGLLEDLIRRRPDTAEYRCNLGLALNNLGLWHAGQEQPKKAIAVLEQGRNVLRPLVKDHPDQPRYRDELARVLLNLAGQQNGARRRSEALNNLDEARWLLKPLIHDYPFLRQYQHRLAIVERQCGHVYRDSGRLEEARAAYEEALRLGEKLVEAQPGISAFRAGLASCCFDLAILNQRQKRPDEMFRCYEFARKHWQALVKANSANAGYRNSLGLTLNNLGHELWLAGKADQALPVLEQARYHNIKAMAAAPKVRFYRLVLSNSYRYLAELHRSWGRLPEAVAAAQDWRKLWENDGNQLFLVACDLAQSAAANNLTLSSGQSDDYARQALDTLRQAVHKGFQDRQRLQNEAAFAGLRQRPEFQALLRQMKATKSED